MTLTLVGTPDVKFFDTASTTSTVSAALTVVTGDILVIKEIGADSAQTISVPTVSGSAATSRASCTAASNTCLRISTYVIPSGTTATVTGVWASTGAWHSMVTEVWRGGQLAATPATNATQTFGAGTTGFTGAVTTTGNGSVVTWCAGDWAAVAFGTIGWLSSATTDGATSNRGGNAADYSSYYAYQAAASPGAQTFGLSTPTGSTFAALAIEIQDPAGVAAPAIPPILVMQTRRAY